jgi:DNA topoisomerase-1
MGNKTLLVVESPSKAKTINKYLGRDYIVEASVGHVKDLEKFKLGVDVEHGFQPKYLTIRGKADIIKKLKKLASEAKEVLLATDPDREGEAIAWHLAEEIKKSNTNIKRVLFNEITKDGIKRAMKEPRDIDENLFMAQQARRVMDRLIGYQVSPILSRALINISSDPLSAGRVQSVALRLIVEREEEIREFIPIPYFTIESTGVLADKSNLDLSLVEFDGAKISNPDGSGRGKTESETKEIQKQLSNKHYIKSLEQAKELINSINNSKFKISAVTKKDKSRKPDAPFTTSTLQQEASKKLGFSNKKTMSVAQRLYEGVNVGTEAVGLITYMRTDSTRVSPTIMEGLREFIGVKYGNENLSATENQYASKGTNTQDAHEAIRPTVLDYSPDKVYQHLEKDEFALYELIYTRFVASQMSNAKFEQTSVDIGDGNFVFRASGSVIKFKGFLSVYDKVKDSRNKKTFEDKILPSSIKEGIATELKDTKHEESKTAPPARYNSASLVKKLDELGIGRPSTYASIVSTLTEREYVETAGKAFKTTDLGEEVNKFLVKNFDDLFNVAFTNEMEASLDTIEEGTVTYFHAMNAFYSPFIKTLDYAQKHMEIEEVLCDKCNAPMDIRVGRTGRFFGCSRYPECNGTKPIKASNQEEKAEPQIVEGMFCDICGKPMLLREGRFGKFYGCSDYPTCKGIKQITTGVKCPSCDKGEISERYSKKTRKKFWSCTNYPDCKFISNFEIINNHWAGSKAKYLEIRYKKTESGYDKYERDPETGEEKQID